MHLVEATRINICLQVLKRKLLARRKFVPWGGASLPRLSLSPKLPQPEAAPPPPEPQQVSKLIE